MLLLSLSTCCAAFHSWGGQRITIDSTPGWKPNRSEPSSAEFLQEHLIGLERERRQIVKAEPANVISIVPSLKTPTRNRRGEPDAHGQLRGVVIIRSSEYDIANVSDQTSLFEEFTSSSLSYILAVVNIPRRNGPKPRSRGRRALRTISSSPSSLNTTAAAPTPGFRQWTKPHDGHFLRSPPWIDTDASAVAQ